MDILFLNWKDIKNPNAGGAEIIAFEYARRLVKEGHRVIFFSRSFEGVKPSEVIDGVRFVRRGGRLSVYLQAFLYYKSLRQKPERVIDMINTICWQTPLFVSKDKRIAYVNQLAKEVWFYEQPFPLSLIGYILERFEYITYIGTKFVCYSKSTKQDLLSFGISDKNIKIFPLGLDHKRYFPSGAKSNYPLFVFVARLVRMKRADLCIKAMQGVVSEFPEAKLAIIGNGPEEKRLEKLVNELNLGKNVVFVNKDNFFIDKSVKDVKVKLLQQAWALLLPSVKEGWGMVVTEAAACGTPSIVSDVTGLRDSVVKNKTGIILSKNPTKTEMSTAMINLIKNKELRNKLGQEAILWSKNFSWENSYKLFKLLLK